MLAQTGHVIGHKNRTGRVHDSHQSARFLRDNVRSVRTDMAFRGILEFRADGAFFHRQVLETCDSLNLEYAIRVPMWPWLNIRGVVKKKRKKDWVWVDRANRVQGLFIELPVNPWDRTERVIPTNRYSANTAWQKLNILAHNLMVSFQLATTAVEKEDRTPRRTTLFLLRPAGRQVLRLARQPGNEGVDQ